MKRPEAARHSRYMWRYDYGDLAVDFVNTRTKRLKPVRTESLGSVGDLLDWIAAKSVLDGAALRSLRRRLVRSPGDASRLFATVLALREAAAGALLARAAGRPMPPHDLRELNEFLACHPEITELATDRAAGVVVRKRSPVDPAELLMERLAGLVVDLFRAAEEGRVRRCAMPDCGSVFRDRTKANRRLWCHAELCGNLSKVARFREVRRAAARGGRGS